MDFELENDLRKELTGGEKLLWTGRPKAGFVLRSADVFLIPFSLFWCGFALFWEFGVIATGAPFFFKIWGIPFVLVGLYMTIGRFFVDSIRRKNTTYGITDNRVIIKSGIISKEIKSFNIRTISDLTFKEKTDGSGTISLGPSDFRYSAFNTMGNWPGVRNSPGLEFIEEVKKVYNILIDQQRRL